MISSLSGCQNFRPVVDLTRYYVLSATATAPGANVSSNRDFRVGIGPVEIPGYLQSSRIVVRRGTNEIHYSESREWAERLDKGIQRVMAHDVSNLRPSIQTVTSAWRTDEVKAELYVLIQRFELGDSGEAVLECEWRIVAPATGQVLHSARSSISKKGAPLASDPRAAVGNLSAALADLSGEIVAALPAP